MKRRVLMFSVFSLLALMVVAGTLLIRPVVASAAPAAKGPHILGTKLHAYVNNKAITNLTYHNGPVMGGTMQVYAIFWEPKGKYVSPTYNSLIERYFADVGGSPLYHINTQYTDTNGNFASNALLAGFWVDTAKYPAKKLSDFQIQHEVTHAMKVNKWTASLTNMFFVFTARGENICVSKQQCSFTTFCAYHSYFGANTIYGVMPYAGTNLQACGVPGSPNNDFDADSTINLTSHEQMEAATDPLLTAWFDSSGNENGDKCEWIFGPPTNGGDVTWNNHTYMVQEEWDNLQSGCAISGP